MERRLDFEADQLDFVPAVGNYNKKIYFSTQDVII